MELESFHQFCWLWPLPSVQMLFNWHQNWHASNTLLILFSLFALISHWLEDKFLLCWNPGHLLSDKRTFLSLSLCWNWHFWVLKWVEVSHQASKKCHIWFDWRKIWFPLWILLTQNQASTFSHGHKIWFPDSLRYCTESLSLGTNLRAPAAKKGRIEPQLDF